MQLPVALLGTCFQGRQALTHGWKGAPHSMKTRIERRPSIGFAESARTTQWGGLSWRRADAGERGHLTVEMSGKATKSYMVHPLPLVWQEPSQEKCAGLHKEARLASCERKGV